MERDEYGRVVARDLTGERFGRLRVIRRAERDPSIDHKGTRWICVCDCGETTVVRSDTLIVGNVRSCKCLFLEMRTASYTGTANPKYKHGLMMRSAGLKRGVQRDWLKAQRAKQIA